MVVKVSGVQAHAPMTKSLLDSDIESAVPLRIQIKIVAEDFVLAARRTKSRGVTRMHRRVRRLDHVAAGKTISPYIAKLIKVIEPSTSDEIQTFYRHDARLNETSCFIGVIANESRLRPEIL